jgi:hypothetical protein
MFGSDILEVIAGVVFIFILISTLCSAIKEGLEAWLKTRAAYLEHGLRQMLQDDDGKGIVSHLFNHPLINGLFSGDYKPAKPRDMVKPWHTGRNLPSYIPSRNFAMALMDIAANGPTPLDGAASPAPKPAAAPAAAVRPTTVSSAAAAPAGAAVAVTAAAAAAATAPAAQATPAATVANAAATAAAAVIRPDLTLAKIRANISRIGNKAVQRALLSAVDHAQGDLEKARQNIEVWYDSAMDRVSGWYRRSTNWVIFMIAIFMAVGLNINTLAIAEYLYSHAAERSVIVSAASNTSTDQVNTYQTAQAELAQMHLPIGWPEATTPASTAPFQFSMAGIWAFFRSLLPPIIHPWTDLIQPMLGWLITAFAATLGAPFWFDVLNKVMSVRSTMKSK